MGVPGMVAALKRYRCEWAVDYQLKDTNLVIDASRILNFMKYHPQAERPDQFGSNMVQLAKFWNEFFDSLQRCNVTPIIVYDGTHLEEPNHSSVSSKYNFMLESCQKRLTMHNMHRDYILPSLALDVFKSIVDKRSEIKIKTQAYYETYPKLARLANENGCPVLTSHSDFILTNVTQGFIWSDLFFDYHSIYRNNSNCKSIPGKLFLHSRFLAHVNENRNLNLAPNITTVLYALLRLDFQKAHGAALKELIPGINKTIGKSRNRINLDNAIARLNNRSITEMRDLIREAADHNDDRTFGRDFESIFMSYTQVVEFEDRLPEPFNESNSTITTKLKRGDLDAEFHVDLIKKQTHLDRSPLEDTETKKSSFSMQDSTRSRLLRFYDQSMANVDGSGIDVYDRCQHDLNRRRLEPSQPQNREVDASLDLHKCFRIEEADRVSLIDLFEQIFTKRISEQITNIMLLIKFNLAELNENDRSSYTNSHVFDHFLMGVYNSFLYYGKCHNLLNEQLKSLVDGQIYDPPNPMASQLRLLERFVRGKRYDSFAGSSSHSLHYIKLKYLIEVLNSSLHAYCQLNSISGNRSPVLELQKYHNAVLVYRLSDYSIRGIPEARNELIRIHIDNLREMILPQMR